MFEEIAQYKNTAIIELLVTNTENRRELRLYVVFCMDNIILQYLWRQCFI